GQRYELSQAHRDLRRWLDWRRDCLLHKPTGRAADPHRTSRGRRRGVRQIGRLPGARLVPRHPGRSIGAAKLRGPCRTFFRTRQSLGISASDDLRRLRQARCQAHSGWTTVALGRGRHHESTRLSRVNGAGRALYVHERFDARGRDAGRGAAARHGRRRSAPFERSSARRRARRRRDRRRRCRRHLAARWLPLPAVLGYKGHSLVFETGGGSPAEALFLEYREAGGEILTPELFPRADGTTYVCAISSTGPVPVDPADVTPDEGAHARLEALCRNISPALAAAPIKARQACFRPV